MDWLKSRSFDEWVFLSAMLGAVWSKYLSHLKNQTKDDLYHLATGATITNILVGGCLLLTGIGAIPTDSDMHLLKNTWTLYWAGGALCLVGWKAMWATD